MFDKPTIWAFRQKLQQCFRIPIPMISLLDWTFGAFWQFASTQEFLQRYMLVFLCQGRNQPERCHCLCRSYQIPLQSKERSISPVTLLFSWFVQTAGVSFSHRKESVIPPSSCSRLGDSSWHHPPAEQSIVHEEGITAVYELPQIKADPTHV